MLCCRFTLQNITTDQRPHLVESVSRSARRGVLSIDYRTEENAKSDVLMGAGMIPIPRNCDFGSLGHFGGIGTGI